MPLFEIEDLSFSYFLGKQKIEAIDSLFLKIPKNSLVTISGPSGSGKSILLNILGLIEPVQQGVVLFHQEDMAQMAEKMDRKNKRVRGTPA
ncbi:MAG: ATP-binding cassette domain-containing protein, partial [Waddliaceae bacterium]